MITVRRLAGEYSIGAFFYGLLLVILDLLYCGRRIARARTMRAESVRAYVLRSFLNRLAIYLLGIALAIRIFEQEQVITVGLVTLLAIPAGLILAAKLGASSGG